MPFEEDIDQFFDPDQFASEAVFTRAGAEVARANVIFNEPSHAVEAGQAEIEETAPFLLATAASVADVRRKDAVEVNGASYVVERVRPDGTGIKRVDLSEAE